MNRTLPTITNITDTFLVYIFIAVIIGVVFMTLLLMYHWGRYHMKDPVVPFAQIVYFLGLFILLGITTTLLL